LAKFFGKFFWQIFLANFFGKIFWQGQGGWTKGWGGGVYGRVDIDGIPLGHERCWGPKNEKMLVFGGIGKV